MFDIKDNMTIKWESNGSRYCLHIRQEADPENPRSDEEISVMACWHRRYRLGDDVVGKLEPYEFWQELVRENVPEADVTEAAIAGKLFNVTIKKDPENPALYDVHLENGPNFDGLSKESLVSYVLEDLTISDCQMLLKPYAEWLPLWLIDHSGISMSCGTGNPFAGPWDSGQVGYIIVLRDKIVAELGLDPGDDDAWRKRAVELMESDVKTYDQYLTGDTYWYETHQFVDDGTENGDWDDLDSCSGFYGSDLMENGMLDSVGYDFEAAIKNNQYEVGEANERVVRFWEF